MDKKPSMYPWQEGDYVEQGFEKEAVALMRGRGYYLTNISCIKKCAEEYGELVEAVHNQDLNNLKLEIGDILISLACLLHIEDPTLTLADVLKLSYEKLINRPQVNIVKLDSVLQLISDANANLLDSIQKETRK